MSYTCSVCSKELNFYNHTYNGKPICHDCFDKKFAVCWFCDKLIPINESYNCGYHSHVCKHCLEVREMIICEFCGKADYKWNFRNVKGKKRCSECYADYLKNDLNIHDHDFKPTPIFLNGKERFKCRSRNPHIGIELEIQGDNREDFCLDLKKEFSDEKLIYLKEDGSLSEERGVEIVTQPMTYNFIKNSNLFCNLFNKMKMFSMNDTDNCGLHFHIDRNCFCKQSDIATIDYIVNNFTNYFETIGGRYFNEDWCAVADKDDDEWGYNSEDYDRYHAVNLENENTVELRFCKSTNDYDTFMNRVKMVFNVIYFAKKYQIKSIMHWGRKEFINRMNKICFEKFGSIVECA